MCKFFKNITRFPEFIFRIKKKRKLKLKYLAYIQPPFILVGQKHVRIGNGFSAESGTRIEAYETSGVTDEPLIEIGDNVCLNYRTHIGAINKVKIGDNVLTGSDVLIIDHDHGNAKSFGEIQTEPIKRELYSKGPVIIGNNVWIGDKVCILSGVTIGDNSIIGAGSIVTKDIPANAIAVGNPARVVRILKEK